MKFMVIFDVPETDVLHWEWQHRSKDHRQLLADQIQEDLYDGNPQWSGSFKVHDMARFNKAMQTIKLGPDTSARKILKDMGLLPTIREYRIEGMALVKRGQYVVAASEEEALRKFAEERPDVRDAKVVEVNDVKD